MALEQQNVSLIFPTLCKRKWDWNVKPFSHKGLTKLPWAHDVASGPARCYFPPGSSSCPQPEQKIVNMCSFKMQNCSSSRIFQVKLEDKKSCLAWRLFKPTGGSPDMVHLIIYASTVFLSIFKATTGCPPKKCKFCINALFSLLKCTREKSRMSFEKFRKFPF